MVEDAETTGRRLQRARQLASATMGVVLIDLELFDEAVEAEWPHELNVNDTDERTTE